MMEVPMVMQATASSEIRVNTTTQLGQNSPSMATLADGGWVVIWSGNGLGDQAGIVLQRYDASGAPVGGEVPVNTFWDGSQHSAFVTALADGGWVATWSGRGPLDTNGVFQQRFDSTGAAVGEINQMVNDTTSGEQVYGSAAALADGGWAVVWQGSGTGDDYGIMLRRYDASGNTVAPDVRVNSVTAGTQYEPAITAMSDGGWLVTWQSDSGAGMAIHQQRYSSAFVAVGAQTKVNTSSWADRRSSSVTELADGGWVITWHGRGGHLDDVFQRRYDANGVAVGDEERLNNLTTGDQAHARVAALADGGWVAVWFGNGPGDTDGIYQKRFDANGVAHESASLVNTTTAGEQWYPSVTALDDGSWVVAWQSNDGNDSGIYQRHYAAHKIGSASDDTLTGTAWSEWIDGRVGNDSLKGGGGDDSIDGGEGRDYISGDTGNDYLRGGGGNDSLVGGLGEDTLTGNSGNDKLLGGADNDTLSGGTGNDKLDGGTGKDYLAGDADNDVLSGGADSDRLLGGSGADTLYGGTGKDTLKGGLGADYFQFKSIADSGILSSTRDLVSDFTQSEGDKLDLSAIDADTTLLGNQAFVFDKTEGTSASMPANGHIAWYRTTDLTGSNTFVLLNNDGDKDVDMVIQLKGSIDLSGADFIL
jgi:Ca2+-binding RTX toxin-like protein